MKKDFFTLDIPIPNTKDGKFVIPDSVERIMFDIGASYHAPNTHNNMNEQTFIVTVEPDPRMWMSFLAMWYHTQILPKGKNPLHLDHAISPEFFDNFSFLPCAIGDGEKFMEYNLSVRDGKSSLLKPNTEYEYHQPIARSVPVRVMTLSALIDMIPEDRVINLVKIDCQGYDEQVVLSGKDRLDRVEYLAVENGKHESMQYSGAYSVDKFISTLNDLGFNYYCDQGGQQIYYNTRRKTSNSISKYTFNIG